MKRSTLNDSRYVIKDQDAAWLPVHLVYRDPEDALPGNREIIGGCVRSPRYSSHPLTGTMKPTMISDQRARFRFL
jgi:hypothetical protein